jgi:hypothetical protein
MVFGAYYEIIAKNMNPLRRLKNVEGWMFMDYGCNREGPEHKTLHREA